MPGRLHQAGLDDRGADQNAGRRGGFQRRGPTGGFPRPTNGSGRGRDGETNLGLRCTPLIGVSMAFRTWLFERYRNSTFSALESILFRLFSISQHSAIVPPALRRLMNVGVFSSECIVIPFMRCHSLKLTLFQRGDCGTSSRSRSVFPKWHRSRPGVSRMQRRGSPCAAPVLRLPLTLPPRRRCGAHQVFTAERMQRLLRQLWLHRRSPPRQAHLGLLLNKSTARRRPCWTFAAEVLAVLTYRRIQ